MNKLCIFGVSTRDPYVAEAVSVMNAIESWYCDLKKRFDIQETLENIFEQAQGDVSAVKRILNGIESREVEKRNRMQDEQADKLEMIFIPIKEHVELAEKICDELQYKHQCRAFVERKHGRKQW